MSKIIKVSGTGNVTCDRVHTAFDDADDIYRRHLFVGEDRCSFGLLIKADSVRNMEALEVDELVIVREGELRILTHNRPTIKLKSGECALIPAGSNCRIDHSDLGWAVFMQSAIRSEDLSIVTPDIVVFDFDRPLVPTEFTKVDLLLGPVPQTANHTWYSSNSTAFSAGVWGADAYSRKAVTFGYTELMHLREGSVDITDVDGSEFHLVKGDSVLVPRGTQCLWRGEEEITKIWCVQEPLKYEAQL